MQEPFSTSITMPTINLEAFEAIVKSKLIESGLCHADETGININGKRVWLHCVSNPLWSYYMPHEKRGLEAMQEAGILPEFNGVLCHDHWKPYFKLGCQHALCTVHHLRELERAWEQDKQEWARDMKALLLQINQSVVMPEGCWIRQNLENIV